jgi:hypothetical protein
MNRHRVDLVSLLFGVAFTGLGIGFLTDSIRLTEIRGDWLMPALAVIAGVSILLSTRRPPEDTAVAAESPAPATIEEQDTHDMAVGAESPAPATIEEQDDATTVEARVDTASMWEREQRDADS